MGKVREKTKPLVYPYSYPSDTKRVNRTNDYLDLSRLKKLGKELEKKQSTIKEEDHQPLFEQVVALFKEKLAELKEQNDLPDADSIYLRNGGDEIFVWVLMKDFNEETVDRIGLISLKVSHLILPINVELFTFVDYLDECHLTFPTPEYLKVYSSPN